MAVFHHDERDARSLLRFWLCRILIKTLLQLIPVTDKVLRRVRGFDDLAGKDRRPVPGVTVESTVIAGRPAERITPDRLVDPGVGILYLHGGGFFSCGLNTHRAAAAALARALGSPLVNVDYRQCPDAGVGTSVHDAYAAYQELRASGEFGSIVVAGDSAGGYLAAKVVELAALDGVDGPDAYVGFSPLLNLAPDAVRDSGKDALLPFDRLTELQPFYDRGPEAFVGAKDTTTPSVAAHFPPAVLVIAADEALQKDAFDLQASLDAAGVRNEVHVFAGEVHAFVAMAPGAKQSKHGRHIVVDFVRRALTDTLRDAPAESA